MAGRFFVTVAWRGEIAINQRMTRVSTGTDGLSAKQRRFVLLIVGGANKQTAYVQAFDAAHDKYAGQHAYREAQKPFVAKALAKIEGRVIRTIEAAAVRQGVSKERISEELARIAFCRGKLTKKKDGWDQSVEVAAPIVVNALMGLAKLHGYLIDKSQVSATVTLEQLVERSYKIQENRIIDIEGEQDA